MLSLAMRHDVSSNDWSRKYCKRCGCVLDEYELPGEICDPSGQVLRRSIYDPQALMQNTQNMGLGTLGALNPLQYTLDGINPPRSDDLKGLVDFLGLGCTISSDGLREYMGTFEDDEPDPQS